MRDSVEFAVDVSTSVESIAALKAKIKAWANSLPFLFLYANFKVCLVRTGGEGKLTLVRLLTLFYIFVRAQNLPEIGKNTPHQFPFFSRRKVFHLEPNGPLVYWQN